MRSRKLRYFLSSVCILLVFGGFFTSSLGRKIYIHIKDMGRPIARPIKMFFFHPPLQESPETREIVTLLQVKTVYDENSPLQFRRIGRDFDGGYVIPDIAIQKADAIFGYGISDDISFEEAASSLFGKPSWGFDGTCPLIKTNHPLCHFVPQCIVSSQTYLPNSERTATFMQQIVFPP